MKNSENNSNKEKGTNIKQETFIKNGNSIQAGRDIHLYQPESSNNPQNNSKSHLITTWQAVFAIVVSITVILSFVFDLPQKTRSLSSQQEIIQQDSLFVSGIVREKNTDKGIPNAWITSDLKSDTLFATSDGTFEFYVKGKPGESIRIYAGAQGYVTRNEYHTLPKSIPICLDKR